MSVLASLVSGVLPVLPDGRMLLLQRNAGTWEPPAGRLATGEDFEPGASRELYEETGLALAPDRMLATWVGPRPGGKGLLASVMYASRAPGEAERAVRLSDEHLAYRWATIEDWLSLPSWWSPENILRVPRMLETLPESSTAVDDPGFQRPNGSEVLANLGSGTVLVDPSGPEPRALLMRRRKPPVGLWENPGGMLESGEDFESAARREMLEETGLAVPPENAWWARVEPWRGPDDRDLYAGVGFVARYPGGEVVLEEAAHDAHIWATRAEWEALSTWYTPRELDDLWAAIERMPHANDDPE